MFINNEQLYINLETKYSAELDSHVYIKDVAQVYCNDHMIKKKVENIRIYNGKDYEMYDYITGSEMTEKILQTVDNVDVVLTGGPDVLIEVKGEEETNKFFRFIKIVLVMIILFFGAAAAIMNFYEDVNISKLMEKIYFSITGIEKKNPLILTIPLSIGTGLGMFAFFSRIFSFSKRRRQEPGPMELELYLYDKDVEDNILNDLKKQKR